MKTIILISILIFFTVFVSPNAFGHLYGNEVEWEVRNTLTWDDFVEVSKPYPDCNEDRDYDPAACIRTHINFEWDAKPVNSSICQFQVISLNATGVMEPDNSWVGKGKQTPERLKHEEDHFHISEITSRLFEKYVLFKIFKCSDNQYDKPKILQFLIDKIDSFETDVISDKEYDDAISKSKDKYIQESWNRKVDTFLIIYNEPNLNDYIVQAPTPLSQIRDGTNPEDIQCKSGWKRVVKSNNESASCVTPAVAKQLEKRGWGKIVGTLIIISNVRD